jgi:hypothetical protein
VVLVAGGFPGYATEEDEIRAITRLKWHPQTPDFELTAAAEGSYKLVSTPDEVIDALTTGSPISRIVIISHGSPLQLGLGGDADFMISGYRQTLNADFLKDESVKERIKRITLKAGATLDIIACNVALGKDFMEALANAFNCPVRAFKMPIIWEHPISNDGKKIERTGKTGKSESGPFEKGFSHLRFDEIVKPASAP